MEKSDYYLGDRISCDPSPFSSMLIRMPSERDSHGLFCLTTNHGTNYAPKIRSTLNAAKHPWSNKSRPEPCDTGPFATDLFSPKLNQFWQAGGHSSDSPLSDQGQYFRGNSALSWAAGRTSSCRAAQRTEWWNPIIYAWQVL